MAILFLRYNNDSFKSCYLKNGGVLRWLVTDETFKGVRGSSDEVLGYHVSTEVISFFFVMFLSAGIIAISCHLFFLSSLIQGVLLLFSRIL